MRKLLKNPALWVFLITIVLLSIHPLAECFDCEGPNPWGRNDLFYYRAIYVFDAWFLITSIASGFCSIRKYWIVPFSLTFAYLVTQPLGGVPMWSLRANEGPVIVIAGVLVGVASLLAGVVIRVVFNLFRPLAHP